jgi:GSH-dependent disulfide-bond oxidoreductase
LIELFTAPTPNGMKVMIALQEMELEHKITPINLQENEQKQDWYVKLNPNGRVPTIIDHDNGDFPVFESGAILIYLAEKTGKFLPKDVKGRSVVIQWLMWQMGGLGPMMGQANVFFRYAPEKLPWAIDRYHRESRRLLAILDNQLKGKDYVCGDYSIADMACYPWARGSGWGGIDVSGLGHLAAWLKRVEERPAVKRAAPQRPPSAAQEMKKEDLDKAVEGARKFLA